MKKQMPADWQYDESKHVGMDYSDHNVSQDYDTEQSRFRDYDSEVRSAIDALGLNEQSVVLDIGCGNGGYTLRLAKCCQHVYAVDISESMLAIARKHAEEQEVRNVTFVNSGFLTYSHKGDKLDAVVTAIALHHLPDFWKQIALKRLCEMLKPGGKLLLIDLVFCFNVEEYSERVENWLQKMYELGGNKIMNENCIHIREEYSTWDWIMKEMLQKAGFNILDEANPLENVKGYVCIKAAS